jgi:hypothetical protein
VTGSLVRHAAALAVAGLLIAGAAGTSRAQGSTSPDVPSTSSGSTGGTPGMGETEQRIRGGAPGLSESITEGLAPGRTGMPTLSGPIDPKVYRATCRARCCSRSDPRASSCCLAWAA